MKSLLSLAVVFFTTFMVQAQEIKGKVTDTNGFPLPDVSVLVTKTNVTAVTDIDGNFTIAANAGDELEFSMINFEKIKLAAANGMSVLMIESDNKELEEVVVIGYGTKKMGSITGSVSQIKSAEILRTPAQSAIQAIQGKAAGINIVTNDEPGATPSIRIRGLGTVLGGRDPLYIIDGVEASGLNGLPPSEIATLDILKDASSLAIYGQKGANGVIIITTKKGKVGKIKIGYDSYYGQKFIQRKVDMADSYRFAYYNNTAQGNSSYFSFDQPYNTDWLDEITQTGEVISNTVSVSGANDAANYYFSATNYKEKGILIGTDYQRNNLNSRTEFKALDGKLKIAQNTNLTFVDFTPRPVSAFTNAYKQSPIVPVRFDNGRWGIPLRDPSTGLIDINGSDRFNNVANPVAQLALTNAEGKSIIISGSVSAEMEITKNLKYTSNFGATYGINKGFTYNSALDNYLVQNATKNQADYEATFGDKEVLYNTLSQYRNDNYNWNWDNYVTYKLAFDKHDITVTAGMSRTTKNISSYLNGSRNNVPENSDYWNFNFSNYGTELAPGSVVQGGSTTPIVSIAYFARGEYEYDGKYLLTAVVRREGSSNFQDSKKWAVFPSISAGWIVSNESFMQNSKVFNFLKVRGGYGEIGNANSVYSLNIPIFSPGNGYPFGENQLINPGSNQPYQIDPNLTWETMREIDLGIDFKTLNNKLSGTIDIYDRKSIDVILPVSLPPVLSPGDVTVNTGNVSNKGVELSLRWEDRINDKLNYWVSGNYSYNKNKLDSADNQYFANFTGGGLGNGQVTKQVLEGEALGSFYVYQVTGLNGDGALTYSDERVVAGSYLPTSTFGLSLGVNYGNFDFSVDTYGVAGNKVYNGKKAQRFGGENVEFDYLDDFWTPSTPNAANPTPFNEVPRASTYFIEDGSFFRINNITLGYTLPKFYEKIDKVRIYFTATNPFLFTKYTGYSPEVVGSDNANPLGSAGIELDAYPTNKTFLFGLNMSL